MQKGFQLRQFGHTALVLVLAAVSCTLRTEVVAAQTDTASIRAQLQQTAREYERSLRRNAPLRPGSSGGRCDEVVGRFCLFYDVGPGPPLPPEPERMKQARDRAVEAFTAGFEVWPGDTLVAAPLVRFLVEADRAAQAVTVARRFGQSSSDSVWSGLLLGFALHAHRSTAEAEQAFDDVLGRLRPSEREDMRDVRYLLDPAEKPRYRELRGDPRDRYEGHLWRLADPLYLTPGNESRAEHMARQVYGRILARAPLVAGAFSWADDLEELTQRFGVPKARTQDYSRPGLSTEPQITEHYDPDQLTYVPPEILSKDGINLFEPGAAWPYDTIRSRTGYAPTTVRRMAVLEHQLSRFPVPDSVVVRADLRFPLDSAVKKPARVEVGLFVLDSALQTLRSVRDTIVTLRDTAFATVSLALPEGATAYSLEARELETGLAARARYLLPLPLISRPILSDLVLLNAGADAPPTSRSSNAFQPLPSLRVARDAPVAIYLEARGLSPDDEHEVRYRVDLEVLDQSKPGAFSRSVKRLGRALGLGGDDVAPRITWTERAQSAAFIPIALKLGQLRLDPGLKQFRVTVTDLDSGLSGSVVRLVRIERNRS